MRSSSAGIHTEPPPTIDRRLETSYRSTSGHSSSRHAWVGTRRHVVTRCRSVSASWCSGVQRPGGGMYTSVVPVPTDATAAS